jgi:isoleucyl-tRNA synthetase
VKPPSGRVETAPASEIVRKLGSSEYGGSYFTFSDENNFTIWAFLKKCHEEGFIYRGHDVMPWCGRCGTGLSQMEVAEGRRITTHTSVFVRFPLKGQEKTALLVWTTTPWTLASNVAVAVNPDMTYVKVRHGDWTYYVAKANFERDRVQELQVEGKHETHKLPSIRTILKGSGTIEVLEELPGRDLLGLAYTGLARPEAAKLLRSRIASLPGKKSARRKVRVWSISRRVAVRKTRNSARKIICLFLRRWMRVLFFKKDLGCCPAATQTMLPMT